MRDRHSGHPRGFGFVSYDDEAIADRVAADRHELDGRQVEAKRAVPRSECTPVQRATHNTRATKKIFVGGLPATCRDREFYDYFARFGDIAESQVMYDHQTSNSRGFGFVTFSSETTVERVVNMDHDIMGKFVEVKRAEPKQVLEARRNGSGCTSTGAANGTSIGSTNGATNNFAGLNIPANMHGVPSVAAAAAGMAIPPMATTGAQLPSPPLPGLPPGGLLLPPLGGPGAVMAAAAAAAAAAGDNSHGKSFNNNLPGPLPLPLGLHPLLFPSFAPANASTPTPPNMWATTPTSALSSSPEAHGESASATSHQPQQNHQHHQLEHQPSFAQQAHYDTGEAREQSQLSRFNNQLEMSAIQAHGDALQQSDYSHDRSADDTNESTPATSGMGYYAPATTSVPRLAEYLQSAFYGSSFPQVSAFYRGDVIGLSSTQADRRTRPYSVSRHRIERSYW